MSYEVILSEPHLSNSLGVQREEVLPGSGVREGLCRRWVLPHEGSVGFGQLGMEAGGEMATFKVEGMGRVRQIEEAGKARN